MINKRIKRHIIIFIGKFQKYYDRIFLNRKSIYPVIFVLGNQKSGTSVIAHLLSHYGGLSKTIDTTGISGKHTQDIYLSRVKLINKIKNNPRPFTNNLVKEPSLTFVFDQLIEIYPNSRYVFVMRNPYDNIRSILNRLNLPGNNTGLTEEIINKLDPNWRYIITGSAFGESSLDYIETLALRWNTAADVYLKNKDNLVLVKYEEFVTNKAKFISDLAKIIGIEKVNDISNKIDIQYQPKGKKEDPIDFFGKNNYNRITSICSEKAKQLMYLN